jgi:hypothetical protein
MRTGSTPLIACAAVAAAVGSAFGAGASAPPLRDAGPAVVTDAVALPVAPAAYLTKHHDHDDGDGHKGQADALKYLHDDMGSDYDFNANYPTGPIPGSSVPPLYGSKPPPVAPAPAPVPAPDQAPAPGQPAGPGQ